MERGLVTHIDRSDSVDAALALKQWGGYVAALEDHGWDVFHAPPLDDCPDGCFIEDNLLVCKDGENSTMILMNSSSEERREEVVGLEEDFLYVVDDIGRDVARITSIDEQAFIDGGDVLKVGNIVYIGQSGRTNRAGIEAVSRILRDRGMGGLEVVRVPTNLVLHLKSAITALPCGTIIGHKDNVDDAMLGALRHNFVHVPEIEGTAVVDLGEGSLLMSAAGTETHTLLKERGYNVVACDICEFEKLEGCVTCLSVRIR